MYIAENNVAGLLWAVDISRLYPTCQLVYVRGSVYVPDDIVRTVIAETAPTVHETTIAAYARYNEEMG